MSVMTTKRVGFTIVELLIVIVVIAILATISVVAYNGVQARSRDSIRKQDLATLAKVTKLYAIDKGDYAEDGCGYVVAGSEGSGWLHRDYDDTGPSVSVNECLMNNENLQRPLRDPSGRDECSGTSCHAYMKVSCSLGTWYLANLETLPQDIYFMENEVGCQPAWDVWYGINYAIKVN